LIAILSKPPGKMTLASLAPRISRCPKPVIVCFLGFKENILPGPASRQLARTLDEAAMLAVQAITGRPDLMAAPDSARIETLIHKERVGKTSAQKYLRGLFAGGTFCYQAQQILQEYGMEAYSNAPLEGNLPLPNSAISVEHTLVDMGADEFTSGRPHPMIDSRWRYDRILTEGRDPEIGILLLDIILGFNSCSDPAGDLAPAIAAAKKEVNRRGGSLSVIASICGTEDDAQDLNRQIRILEDAGALVFPSNAQAVRFSAQLAKSFK
jgi:FdrA protein